MTAQMIECYQFKLGFPRDKKNSCPGVPLSLDVPGQNELEIKKKMTRTPVLEHHFPVLEHHFPVLEHPFLL